MSDDGGLLQGASVEGAERDPMEILHEARCGSCRNMFAGSPTVLMLERLATWEYPTHGNVLTGENGLALAVICERCFTVGCEPVEAVEIRDGRPVYHEVSALAVHKPARKVYSVRRNAERSVYCKVLDVERARSYELHHWPIHSPTGFEIGYGGSGPADLALAIAADHYGVDQGYDFARLSAIEEGPAAKAWKLHQRLKWAHLSGESVRDGIDITDRMIAAVEAEAAGEG